MNNTKIPSDMLVGTEHKINSGGSVVVMSYACSTEVIVNFVGYTHSIATTADTIRKGAIKNFMATTMFNKGYIGLGKYGTSKNIAYKIWVGMLERCYCSKFSTKHPTYKGCTVDDNWLNFQIFAKWFHTESNYKEGFQLDKDILYQGNKLYSSKTCIFVTSEVNSLVLTNNAKRGEYKLGVYLHKANGKMRAMCSVGKSKQISLGMYNTEDEAHEAYCDYKYGVIQKIAVVQEEPLKSALLKWVIPEY
jgi:hypothetical protein